MTPLCWLHASSNCLAWAAIQFNSHHGCNWAKELEVSMIIYSFFPFISLPPLFTYSTLHHNNMYCHATTYCQKAFVPSMCAHCFTYCQLMLNPEKSPSLFPSFLFGTSAIWFKWAPLQLASLQLWRFTNCCTVHWRCCYYLLLALCLPEKFFFLPFAGKLSLLSRGRGLHQLTALLWKKTIFSFWIFCSWCLTDLFCRGSPSSKLISARFELTSVKCLSYFYLDLTWLSTFQTSLVMRRLWLCPRCLSFICRLWFVLSVMCFPFPNGMYLTLSTSHLLDSHRTTEHMYLKPAC